MHEVDQKFDYNCKKNPIKVEFVSLEVFLGFCLFRILYPYLSFKKYWTWTSLIVERFQNPTPRNLLKIRQLLHKNLENILSLCHYQCPFESFQNNCAFFQENAGQ